MEPTTSGTQYLFSLTGRISAKELNVDDDETESTSEDGASAAESEVQAPPVAVDRVNAFPKTIILGTGSSFPGVTKSVTSILVRVK